ncbi:MAG: hypothetical protein JO131_04680 [Gammaproteobacteria bacterium]|nr:hypothetical protein [Gammaproteobacteria bacterium]
MFSVRTAEAEEKKLVYGIFEKSDETFYSPVNMKLGRCQNTYKIYKPEEINNLLSKVEEDVKSQTWSGTNRSREGYIIVRFLVRQNGNLILAEEGPPGGSIPAHVQLSVDPEEFKSITNQDFLKYYSTKFRCLAAGNAFFNKNHELCQINQKTGDYQLPFISLQFGIQAFLANPNIKIADELIVTESCEDTHYVLKTKEYLPKLTPASEKSFINKKNPVNDFKSSTHLNTQHKLENNSQDSKKLILNKVISPSQHTFFSANAGDLFISFLREIGKAFIGLLIPMPLTLWDLSQAEKRENNNNNNYRP